jgi:hypothetical protein
MAPAGAPHEELQQSADIAVKAFGQALAPMS